MDNEINFKAWDMPDPTKDDMERMFGRVEAKFKKREARVRNLKIYSPMLATAAIVASIYLFHMKSMPADVVQLRAMLNEEIEHEDIAVKSTDSKFERVFGKGAHYVSNI